MENMKLNAVTYGQELFYKNISSYKIIQKEIYFQMINLQYL